MNKHQSDKFDSFVKIHDFLEDYAAALSTVPQIALGTTQLGGKIGEFTAAANKGDRDLSGYMETKEDKKEAMRSLMYKVSRGAAAYYLSIGNKNMWKELNPSGSEFDRLNEDALFRKATDIHALALPHAAVLIGASAADLTALNAAWEEFGDVRRDYKREVEESSVANESIPAIIHQADEIVEILDAYMQTFADAEPTMYNIWKKALRIDDTGSTATPDLTSKKTAPGGGTATTVTYVGLPLSGSTDIKMTAESGGPVRFGFGIDPTSIVPGKEKLLPPNTSERYTAATLGYTPMDATFLNIINDEAGPAEVKVDFFLQD